MRRRAIRWAGLLALVLLAAVPLQAETETGDETPVTVADLDWLAGHWVGELDGAVIEEHWSTPGGSVVMGMFRWVKPQEDGAPAGANRIALYELFAIEPGDDGRPVLRLRHFSPGLVAWEDKDAPLELRLVESGDKRAVWETSGEDGPVRLEYRRPEPDLLLAVLVDGDKRTEFHYRRVGG